MKKKKSVSLSGKSSAPRTKKTGRPHKNRLKFRLEPLSEIKPPTEAHVSAEAIDALNTLFQEGTNGLALKAHIVKMIDVIHRFISYDVVSVKFLDALTGEVCYRYICDKNNHFIEPETIVLEDRLSKRVYQSKETFFSNEFRADKPFTTFLAVPLILRSKLIGVISLLGDGNLRLRKSDISLVEMCASNLALLMNHAEFTTRSDENYYNIFRALVISLEAKDRYTRGHSQRVADYSLRVGRKLKCSKRELEILEKAAYLHDIGKIAISDSILNKPGRLTRDEYLEIQSHVLKGATILKTLGFDEEIVTIAGAHHECYNGQGYPNRWKGHEIPLLARIINVADAYDAMVTDRPYRKALPKQFAFKQLERCAGVQFCPEVVHAFLSLEL